MTLFEAYFTNERCVRASWVALLIGTIVLMNGWLPFWIFANEIYALLLGDDPVISPRDAVYITSFVQLAGAMFSMFIVSMLGRKTLLLVGQLLCALSLLATGLSIT